MIAQDLKSALQTVCAGLAERDSLDWPAFNCPIGSLIDVLKTLRDEHAFDMLTDLAGVDNGLEASPRFSVVYHLYSTTKHVYVRVAVDCESDEEPSVPTATGLWKGANWHERECYDLMGIAFADHPDLRRILMWDEYPHHPLRKDFPLAGHDGELWDEEIADETGTKVKPAPMAGGPFVSPQENFSVKKEPRAKDESWNEKSEKPGK
ncbi:NADH-quinone oxidoreductase subunit C [Puniceicoccaceae bacterium K14]|nr:NADH-quinone oxidoreductase subunit C [Puniceicoccaceae bacterium K14]